MQYLDLDEENEVGEQTTERRNGAIEQLANAIQRLVVMIDKALLNKSLKT